MGFYLDSSGDRTNKPDALELEEHEDEALRPSPGKASRTHGGGRAAGTPGKVSLTTRLDEHLAEQRRTRGGASQRAARRPSETRPSGERSLDLRRSEVVRRLVAASRGHSLPDALAQDMCAALGYDFTEVRVHTNDAAARAASTLGARAFALGVDVYFDRGQYRPGTTEGDALIAHELTHVVQHEQGRIPGGGAAGLAVSRPGDSLEHEADRIAGAIGQWSTHARAGTQAQEGEASDQARAPLDPRERTSLHAATWLTATALDALRPGRADHGRAGRPAIRRGGAAGAASAAAHGVVMGDWWDDLTEGASSAWDGVTDTAEAAWDGVSDAAGEAWDTVTELGADAILALIRAVSPGLAGLMAEGPAAFIQETLVDAVSGWLGGLLGELSDGGVVETLSGVLGGVLGTLQAAAQGDAGCCETFRGWMEGLTTLVTDVIHHPVLETMRDIFTAVNDTLFEVWKLVVAPQFDALAAILGGAWSAVTGMVDMIAGWIAAARGVAEGAWELISDALGISDSSEGGLWSMITEAAQGIWDTIKQTFEPVLEPLGTVAEILLMVSPLGPVLLLIEVVPQVVEAVSWLIDHWGEDDLVEQADQVGGDILPGLARAVTGFGDAISGASTWLVDSLTQLGTTLAELATAVTGVPLVGMASSFISGVASMVSGLVTWAGEQFSAAAEWVTTTAADIWTYVEPICEVLCSLALCAVNPAMIPMVLAGTAWRLIPDCYKGPIIDFILDVVIELLEAAPDLVMFGPLWVALKPGVLGFLRNFRGQDTEVKVAVSNKFAKIISGASLSFIGGFAVGFLQGIWEGLTDPFVMAYMLVKGLVSLAEWLGNLATGPGQAPASTSTRETRSEPTRSDDDARAQATPGETPAQPQRQRPDAATAGAAPTAQVTSAALSARASEMWAELGPEVETIAAQFWPAVESFFEGDGSMSFDDLVAKFQEVWPSIQAAIEAAGAGLSQELCAWFMQDGAEYDIGKGVGWLTGTIVFELLLLYFTAGAGTALVEGSRALKYFLKAIDWTGEALGAAFKLIGKVGGWIMDLVRALKRLVAAAAAGPLRAITESLERIATKLGQWADELFGLAGRGADDVGDAARHADDVGDVARHGDDVGDVARHGDDAGDAARHGDDAADAGDATRRGDDADTPDMTEKLRVAAEAKIMSDGLEAVGTPATAIADALEARFKPRHRWIKRFEAEAKGTRSLIYMIASKILIDEVERPEGYSDLTDEEMDHILGGEFTTTGSHASGGHGFPDNVQRLKDNGYTEITREEFERRLAQEAGYDDAITKWQNASRKTRGRRPKKEDFGLAADHVTMREQKVFFIEPAEGGSFRGGVFPAKNRIHIDGKTWLPPGWGDAEVEAVTRHLIATATPVDTGTMKIYTAFVKIEGGAIHTSTEAAEGFFKCSLLDNGTKRTLFPQMHQ